MKNKYLILCLSLFLIGCKSTDSNGIKLTITKIRKHPFLVDHQRKLIISDSNDAKIAEIKFYTDPGAGCNSYLFQNDSAYVIIDCNGVWYFIDHASGSILDKKWNWKFDIPEDHIGTFVRSNVDNYDFIKEDSIDMKEVYKFKEPIVGETL